MKQMLFNLCETATGRKLAFLTSNAEIESLFDASCKLAYKYRQREGNLWSSFYLIKSNEFNLLPLDDNIPQDVQNAFDAMISSLIDGVDIFFCDYNLGTNADLPICNNILDKYKATDFVIISPESKIGDDPSGQPYMVSYSVPRYPQSGNVSTQHRIYCKADELAFSKSINSIEIQREQDNLRGGIIPSLTPYISKALIKNLDAKKVIDDFLDFLNKETS